MPRDLYLELNGHSGIWQAYRNHAADEPDKYQSDTMI